MTTGEVLAGAVLFLSGVFGGMMAYATGQSVKLGRKPKTVCGCGHSIAFHQDMTGACNHKWWSEYERHSEACGCLQYVGPYS